MLRVTLVDFRQSNIVVGLMFHAILSSANEITNDIFSKSYQSLTSIMSTELLMNCIFALARRVEEDDSLNSLKIADSIDVLFEGSPTAWNLEIAYGLL